MKQISNLSADTQVKQMGYPSTDRPWLKYYSDEAITAPLPKCTLYQYIWENNKDHLQDTAVNYYGTRITYGEFFARVKKVASAFHNLGVRKGDVVTIMSMHTPETLISVYALNYIGAVANMVYMTLSEKEIPAYLRNTDSKLFLVLDIALDRVNLVNKDIPCPVIVLGIADSMPGNLKFVYGLKNRKKKHDFISWKTILQSEIMELPMSTDHEQTAVIVYTSGTTGEPKGVLLSSDNLNSEAHQLRQTDRNYQRKQTVLMILPPFIIFGTSMSHLALSTGTELIICIQLDNDAIGKMFNRYKPNRYVAGPMYLDGIIEHVKGDLSNVIDITGGGDSITSEKEEEFNCFLAYHGSSVRYMTGYGMSEVSAAVTINMDRAYKKGSLGVPLVHTIAKITDTDTGEELSYGEIGEICFSTPGIMQGYYKNEQATGECIELDGTGRRWLHTGDLGLIDQDGFLFFKGRIKRIYMILGTDGFAYKLFPQRIEEYLESKENVESCGVVVCEDKEKLHKAYAFVVLNTDLQRKDELIGELRTEVMKDLPEHLRPESISIIESMPTTPSGKKDYRKLEKYLTKASTGESLCDRQTDRQTDRIAA